MGGAGDGGYIWVVVGIFRVVTGGGGGGIFREVVVAGGWWRAYFG